MTYDCHKISIKWSSGLKYAKSASMWKLFYIVSQVHSYESINKLLTVYILTVFPCTLSMHIYLSTRTGLWEIPSLPIESLATPTLYISALGLHTPRHFPSVVHLDYGKWAGVFPGFPGFSRFQGVPNDALRRASSWRKVAAIFGRFNQRRLRVRGKRAWWSSLRTKGRNGPANWLDRSLW